MNRTFKSIALVATIGATLALAAVTPAAAADSQGDQYFPALNMMVNPDGSTTESVFEVDKGSYKTIDGKTIVIEKAASYVCKGKTDNPHWSTGSASVIAKTRVTCTGPSGNIPINVYSLLGRTTQNNINSLSIVASSQYTQNVPVNGLEQTWYVPALNSGTHIARGAYFRGSHSGAGAPPLIPFNVGAAASAFIYVP